MPDDGEAPGDRPGGPAPGWQADATVTKWVAPPPPPPAMGRQLYGVRANRGLGIAVGVLLGVDVLLGVLNAIARWRTAEAADDLLRGSGDGGFPGGTEQDLETVNSAITFSDNVYGLTVLGFMITAVVATVWFYRARANVALFGLYQPGLAAGWSIAGWFCPFVNWWFPARIANDIWKGSDSRGRRERFPLILAWWLVFQLGIVLEFVGGSDEAGEFARPDALTTLRDNSYVSLAASLVSAVAAVLFVLVVQRITVMQLDRERELWAWTGHGGLPPLGHWPVPVPVPLPGAGADKAPPPPLNPANSAGGGESSGAGSGS
ncbi:hypothetical protein GCM10023205_70710 [Yinghuangia aomiensis]|uniref:DUF4328 domain-containing protein n=1 Tax=Yinghuangia aomiensis TaxID=676205 RepID=A0ABP9I629_9ACTN